MGDDVGALKRAARPPAGAGLELTLAGAAGAVVLGAAIVQSAPAPMGLALPWGAIPVAWAAGLTAAGIGARRLWIEATGACTWGLPRYRPADAGALPLWIGWAEGWMRAVSLEALPHLLVAGQTRAGKSSFVRQMLCGLIEWTRPAHTRILIIDCKGGVEFSWLQQAPHVRAIACDEAAALSLLASVEGAVEDRLDALRRADADDAGQVPGLGRVVVVVDELAELQDSKDAMRSLRRIAARGGAPGVHLVLATQRPDRDALPGPIKANVPASLAYRVRNRTNSEIILDKGGAEDLPPRGHAIWQWVREMRVRTPWLSREDAQARVAAEVGRRA